MYNIRLQNHTFVSVTMYTFIMWTTWKFKMYSPLKYTNMAIKDTSKASYSMFLIFSFKRQKFHFPTCIFHKQQKLQSADLHSIENIMDKLRRIIRSNILHIATLWLQVYRSVYILKHPHTLCPWVKKFNRL